jgi:DNA helicase-2/ATP-dependent DNA helicase PcrA
MSESLAEAIAKDKDSGKCTNASKWKARWVQSSAGQKAMRTERERNNWWLNLADVYEAYRDQLHARSFYDFDDMLVEVNAQLERDPDMLADVQERFSYVLIDEFQDTTPAQLRLAQLVADHFTAEGRPNLMAVGDDDQSIYKFNGAELNNMLGFKRSYPSAEIIVLTDNYRSTQAILNSAEQIIEQAESRLVNVDEDLDKNLTAKNPPKDGEIKALAYASQELQLSRVARQIASEFKPDYHIAVLARSHDSLVSMAAILQKLNVPVRYEQSSNILDHELIDQIYLILKLLAAIQDGDTRRVNSLVHRIVRWPAWGLEPEELWRLAVNMRGKNWLDGLGSSPSKELRGMATWFINLAAKVDSQPLSITIEQIIGLRESDDYESPVKKYLAAGRKDINGYLHGLSAVQLLRALVKEFSDSDKPSLQDFIRFIEINKENGVIVSDESPFITGDHAVQLLSVHKAKGLEFDHVYIIDATEDNWRPSSGGRKPPANLPLQPPLDDFDDYVRLMYVAATRAKSSLTITSYYQDHAAKDVATSTIIQGAFEVEKVSSDDQKEIIAVLEEHLAWPSLRGGQEKEMLKARLEEYSLYATHLSNFMDVTRGGPELFKERHLLYLPEAATVSMSYGTAMHAALEEAQKLTNAGKFNLASISAVFEKTLRNEQLTDSDFDRYSQQGKATLERLFVEFGMQLMPDGLSEQNLRNILLGKARIGGTIDRVDNIDGHLLITDYKTGMPLGSFTTKDKNKAIRAYKHKLQLIFYALLLAEDRNIGTESIQGQMVYVESDSKEALTKAYSPNREDIERVRKLIDAVWRKIINLDLPDTSSYSQNIDGILAFEKDLLAGK